ncbi:transposase [Methylocystis suflitae]|uniref:transposase n=1 Tax=Methylocystis suflitae TaxID=2951405 RepID=UPI00210DE8A7|nr:transposase [Methylocystis suflitae]MCQ4191275.1 transposase [Methylocystis suflitae]
MHAAGARGVVAGISAAAQTRRRGRAQRRVVSALHGHPGVGPISALGFKTSVDDPRRFRRSKTLGAYLGPTARRRQSGSSIDVGGHISNAGNGAVWHPLYALTNNMLVRFRGFSSLKAWILKLAKKRGHKRACVAVARKLAVIMHAMWRDFSEFRFKAPPATSGGTASAHRGSSPRGKPYLQIRRSDSPFSPFI